jgi:hypothetical protein
MISVPRVSTAVDNYFKLIIPATDMVKILAWGFGLRGVRVGRQS